MRNCRLHYNTQLRLTLQAVFCTMWLRGKELQNSGKQCYNQKGSLYWHVVSDTCRKSSSSFYSFLTTFVVTMLLCIYFYYTISSGVWIFLGTGVSYSSNIMECLMNILRCLVKYFAWICRLRFLWLCSRISLNLWLGLSPYILCDFASTPINTL